MFSRGIYMSSQSIKKNAVLNVIKSVMGIIFPLITYPYAARVIGVENIGKINYSASIVSYFTLFAAFGITTYAIRECSKIRDNKEALSKRASEIFSLNLLTTGVSLITLYILAFSVGNLSPYTSIICIQSLSIIFTTIGVDWINVVFEEYKYITIRSIIINVVHLLLLFLLVKNRSDYYQYAFLTVANNIIIGGMNFFYCRRFIHITPSFSKNLLDHFRKLLPFFVNEISIAIYVSADTTMLGALKGDYAVGLYSTAVKVYSIVKTIFIAIYSVTLPRLSLCIGQDDNIRFREILSHVFSTFIVLSVPACTGLFLYSKEIVSIIGSEEFLSASTSLSLLSIALLFAVFGGIFTRCINIPLGHEKTNTTATIIAAIENICLNFIFIPLLSERGAALTTVFAEATVLFFCIWKAKKNKIDLHNVIVKKHIIDALAGCIAIVGIYFACSRMINNTLLCFATGFATSVICYFIMLLIAKNSVLNEYLQAFKIKFKRKV